MFEISLLIAAIIDMQAENLYNIGQVSGRRALKKQV